MKICQYDACTGCAVCSDACPFDAIKMEADQKGFLRPVIEEARCVQCSTCQRICSAEHKNKNEEAEKVFAAYSHDAERRKKATSGGVFGHLAEYILEEGGIVYGAGFDAGFEVKHIRIENKEELYRLSGSKYVQSDIAGIYNDVKKVLKAGRKVLFSGTPCQVSALKNYVGENTHLYTVDVVCHGVPSPQIFADYKLYLNKKFDSDLKNINFRYKEPGWSVYSMRTEFQNGSVYQETKFKDPYLALFSAGGKYADLMLRPSCFKCGYASSKRTGDITLGDFWRIRAYRRKQTGIEKGMNLVLLNNEKGVRLFEKIKSGLEAEERSWDEARASNQSLVKPWDKPEAYDIFWEFYHQNSFESTIEHFVIYDKKREELKIKEAWKRDHAYFIPMFFRKIRGK